MDNTQQKQDIRVYLGALGGGKDFSAKPYIQKGYKHCAFADTLRDILWDILGYKPKNYEKFKLSDVRLGFLNKISTGRKLLQNLGSTLRKFIAEDVWVDILIKNIAFEPKVVITDCRFSNEVAKLLKYAEKAGSNITFIWCCYPSKKYQQGLKETHESEALAQFITQRYNFKNGDTISIEQIKVILKDYKRFRLSKRGSTL